MRDGPGTKGTPRPREYRHSSPIVGFHANGIGYTPSIVEGRFCCIPTTVHGRLPPQAA
jgi:hypothetical protein